MPAYLSELYSISGKVGEGTYGVVYLAYSRDSQRRLLAIKTFKPGKVQQLNPSHLHVTFTTAIVQLVDQARPLTLGECSYGICSTVKVASAVQEGDGISPTAIREIMLLKELRHKNIVSLEAVHFSRKVGHIAC